MIVRVTRNGRPLYLLVTSSRTYEHKTRASAERQETAINLAKARRAGHRIPRRPSA